MIQRTCKVRYRRCHCSTVWSQVVSSRSIPKPIAVNPRVYTCTAANTSTQRGSRSYKSSPQCDIKYMSSRNPALYITHSLVSLLQHGSFTIAQASLSATNPGQRATAQIKIHCPVTVLRFVQWRTSLFVVRVVFLSVRHHPPWSNDVDDVCQFWAVTNWCTISRHYSSVVTALWVFDMNRRPHGDLCYSEQRSTSRDVTHAIPSIRTECPEMTPPLFSFEQPIPLQWSNLASRHPSVDCWSLSMYKIASTKDKKNGNAETKISCDCGNKYETLLRIRFSGDTLYIIYMPTFYQYISNFHHTMSLTLITSLHTGKNIQPDWPMQQLLLIDLSYNFIYTVSQKNVTLFIFVIT